MADGGNYPRYPVDLFKLTLIFLGGKGNISGLPKPFLADERPNPFGTAFVKKYG